MVNIHSHNPDATAAIVCLQIYPNDDANLNFADQHTIFSLGIHPWTVNASSHHLLEKMESMLQEKQSAKIAAIGECGLDRIKNKEELSGQKAVFCSQIQLANKYRLPLILHCVKAHGEVDALLEQEKNRMPVLFHGVSGKKGITDRLVQKGYFFSFGKSLLSGNPATLELFKALPVEQLFLETDDSDAEIKTVYRIAAETRDIPLEKLVDVTKQNYNKFFSL